MFSAFFHLCSGTEKKTYLQNAEKQAKNHLFPVYNYRLFPEKFPSALGAEAFCKKTSGGINPCIF